MIELATGCEERKSTMLSLWQFGLDAQRVMPTRILRMMAGELTSRSAPHDHREADSLFTRSNRWCAGSVDRRPLAASREMIEVYRLAASANCSSLPMGGWGPRSVLK
jgi:hypothetical protein